LIKIGDIEVHRIEEVVIYEPTTFLPDFQREGLMANLSWLVPNYYDSPRDMFPATVHSWLLKTPTHTILVDTCSGNGKTRPLSPRLNMLNTPWLERLEDAGVKPEDVDLVVLTHLHVDHVGWNTRLVDGQWVPTFPNAQHIISHREYEAQDPSRGAVNKPADANLPFIDSVQPVVDAGLVRFVEGNERLLDGIDLMPIPGHTPGMIALRVKSNGEEAIFAGDIAHQPLQIAFPDWSTKYCADPKQAALSRRKMLDYCAKENCLLLPVHFGWPHCGRIARRGNDFVFLPHDREP
jgi:glyoxylase-like metal-dependent hydrolase (beta-lactamase superfamily II)